VAFAKQMTDEVATTGMISVLVMKIIL